MKAILHTISIVIILLAASIPPVHAVTLTVGNGSGPADSTIVIPISVDAPEGIAGAAFTLNFNNSLSVSVRSSFFDTFLNQFVACGLSQSAMDAIEIPTGYSQPLITNPSAAGDQIKIAAARCQPASAGESSVLFSLDVSLKNGEAAGPYSLTITPTILNNTDAGYDAAGEAIDLLIGSDINQPVTSPAAFPVILAADGYAAFVVAGQVEFENVPPYDDPNTDDDGDGYSEMQGDIDDSNIDISPNALEDGDLNDGIDNNCDGMIDNIFCDKDYLAANLDVAHAVANGWFLSGWQHFVDWGEAEGRNCAMPYEYGDYSEEYYLAGNLDVAHAVAAGVFVSGWEHYWLCGKYEGRSDAMPEGYDDFNEEYYLARNLDVAHAVANGWFLSGWEHYVVAGAAEGRSAAMPDGYGDYNEEYYLAGNLDVAHAVADGVFLNGWEHYVVAGAAEGRSAAMPDGYGDYNEEYYLAGNLDVAHAVADGVFLSGWEHYVVTGAAEGRSSAMPEGYGDFNEEYYLANNPDVAHAVADGVFLSGWEHYVVAGAAEGRSCAQPEHNGFVYGGVCP